MPSAPRVCSCWLLCLYLHPPLASLLNLISVLGIPRSRIPCLIQPYLPFWLPHRPEQSITHYLDFFFLRHCASIILSSLFCWLPTTIKALLSQLYARLLIALLSQTESPSLLWGNFSFPILNIYYKKCGSVDSPLLIVQYFFYENPHKELPLERFLEFSSPSLSCFFLLTRNGEDAQNI